MESMNDRISTMVSTLCDIVISFVLGHVIQIIISEFVNKLH